MQLVPESVPPDGQEYVRVALTAGVTQDVPESVCPAPLKQKPVTAFSLKLTKSVQSAKHWK